MWYKIVTFVQRMYGDLPQTMESNSYSRATTPEQIIGAAILTSMQKKIEDWQFGYYGYNTTYSKQVFKTLPISWLNTASKFYIESQDSMAIFRNEKRDIEVQMKAECTGVWGYMRVNYVRLDEHTKVEIIRMFKKRRSKIEQIEKAAADALQRMKDNETAWNLAEKLLDMKRNEHGALVPNKPVQEVVHDKSVDDILVEIEDKKDVSEGLGACRYTSIRGRRHPRVL